MSLAPVPENTLFVADTLCTGRGLFTADGFSRGELVVVLDGEEHHLPGNTLDDALGNPNWIGVGEHRWIDPTYPCCFLNHSCEPNLGTRGDREFVALRAIAPGEELTFDYSITEHDELWQMACACGTERCRQVIRSIQFLPRAAFEGYLPHINSFFRSVYERATGAAR